LYTLDLSFSYGGGNSTGTSNSPNAIHTAGACGLNLPVAVAAPVDTTATPWVLDGTGSYDKDNDVLSLDTGSLTSKGCGFTDPLLYQWTVAFAPGGSAVIVDDTKDTASFTPDASGPYTFALTVTDATAQTGSTTVSATAP
jgi:hypothetical protein